MIDPLKNLKWIEELLPDDVVPKKMHEGLGYYLDEKLVLILIEASHTRVHKGIDYPFEIWNGCFFPVEKLKQNTVIGRFLFLENHPALKNCLYLPAQTEDFEDLLQSVVREIKKRNRLFGIYIKIKRPDAENADDTIKDTRKPQLFNTDAPQKNKKIVPKKKPAPQMKTQKSKADKKSENAFILSKLSRKN